jgi:intergrase/recombinase
LFKEYRLSTARDRLSYARRFKHCLLSRDFSGLRKLSDDKRVHVLKALSALAKFLGIYDDFKALRRNYGLKWSGKNSDDIIIARLTKVVNGSEVYDWMRRIKMEIPEYAAFIDFMAATGLRYEEAINAWNLIIELARKGSLSDYYKENKQVLEHFRFREVFIRKSKKAFMSFVSDSLVAKIVKSETLTKNILPNRIKRRKLRLRFGDIRELHASVLTKHLRQPEIDFIHGRVSTSVFMRNYFNPVWISDLRARTLRATGEILEKIN